MKLGNLLRERKQLVGEISRLEARAKQAAIIRIVKEGDKEVEKEDYSQSDFEDIIQRLGKKREKLLAVKKMISAANRVPVDGTCIQNLVIRRGELKEELSFWESLRSAHVNSYEHNKTRVPMKEVDKKVDELVEIIAVTEAKINELNARVEVDEIK